MARFEDLGLNPMILKALGEIGFEKPTPIQEKTIPKLINNEDDIIALAQTGTGKTAAFSLPIIQKLNKNDDSVQSLVLCPTRELAIQVAKDISNYLKYSLGFSVMPVFGGERIDIQIRALKRRPHIVVGTPGRVNDLIRRKVLKIGAVKWLVLDEADEMLSMGFKEELDEILSNMPDNKQVSLFSATMNQQVRRIASNYMRNPKDITVGKKNEGADNVKHYFYMVHEKDRYQALRRIADLNPNIHGIVFCRTRRETQLVADKLIQDHYSAEAIHGDISQDQRIHVMNRFKKKKVQLLVATDVAARGIDVDKLTHVINYNLPDSLEAYVHRSGRTGRAHNKGVSLVIVNMREKYKIKALEKKIGKSFENERIPTGSDICEKQLLGLVEKVCEVDVNEDQIGKYLDLISQKFEHMDREELLKKFISVEFNRFIDHYKDAVDLNKGVASGKGQRNESSVLFARFNLNMGRNTGLNVKELMQFLNSQPGLRGVEIGKININNDNTTLEIDEKFKDKVLDSLNNADMDGVAMKVFCEATGLRSSRSLRSGRSRGRDRSARFGGSRNSSRRRRRR